MDYNRKQVDEKLDRNSGLFHAISELLRALSKGQDGIDEAVVLKQGVLERLPTASGGYIYPWFCLLAALVSDNLRMLNGAEPFFDAAGTDKREVLNRALYAQKIFSDEPPLEPFSDEVASYLEVARGLFVDVCWHVIEPDEHEFFTNEDKSLLWDLLKGIDEDDKHKPTCEGIYHGLLTVLASGPMSLPDILCAITGVELGDDWPWGNLSVKFKMAS